MANDMNLRNCAFKAAIICLGLMVSGFLVPNDFEAVVEVSDAGDVSLSYEGNGHLFLTSHYPITKEIPKKLIPPFTKRLRKSTEVIFTKYLSLNVWKLKMFSEVKADDWPKGLWGEKPAERIRLPRTRKMSLLKVTRPIEKTVQIETKKFGKRSRGILAANKFQSRGVFKIKTSGKLIQTSGPALKKNFFGNTYETKLDMLNDPPLNFTITLE